MPGMNLYYTFGTVSSYKRTKILGYGAESGDQNLRNSVLIEDKRWILACTGYEGYPFLSFETDEFHIVLEGCIYSESDGTVRPALAGLAKNLTMGSDPTAREGIRSWLSEADGEFIIVTYHKPTGQVFIVTDALGRLPLYYSKDEQSIVVSRHLDLVVALQERKDFNRLAIAHYLMFGYSLGVSTLVRDVYGLEPCSVITIEPRSSLIDIQPVSTFCFSEKLHSNKSVEVNAEELARLLSVACVSRTKSSRRNVVSLSGGLDSRTIAACICKAGIPLSTTTMLDTEGSFVEDVRIAEKIAQALGVEWKLYKLHITKGENAYRLLHMKVGLNYLAMNYMVQYLDALRNEHGSRLNYITGDGGDKVLVDLRPTRSLKSLEDLVQYILSRHQGNSVQCVSRMTGLSVDEIICGICDHVDSYPEDGFDDKLVHFVIFERGRRWLFEGEDRNRNFFWHLAPFYGINFFRYAMNCSDEQKANHKLYKELLVNLSPEVANIPNNHWGFSITSKKYRWTVIEQYFRDLIPRPVKGFLKGMLRPVHIPREMYKECVTKQVASCDVIKDYLLFPELVKRLNICNKREAQTLLTVTSTLELLSSGRSTIKEYWEDEI